MSNPTPLTRADSGAWYDPDENGTGFHLAVLDGGRHFSEFFAGAIPGWFEGPSWFSIQGIPDAYGALPLLLTVGAVMGETHPLNLARVGHVTFDRVDHDTITAHVVVSGNGKPDFSPAPPARVTDLRLRRAYERTDAG